MSCVLFALRKAAVYEMLVHVHDVLLRKLSTGNITCQAPPLLVSCYNNIGSIVFIISFNPVKAS